VAVKRFSGNCPEVHAHQQVRVVVFPPLVQVGLLGLGFGLRLRLACLILTLAHHTRDACKAEELRGELARDGYCLHPSLQVCLCMCMSPFACAVLVCTGHMVIPNER
jgi:hypothetical protein